jgi:hypothetical protein
MSQVGQVPFAETGGRDEPGWLGAFREPAGAVSPVGQVPFAELGWAR